ncbi:7192_t:CDS:2 [Dentiscutata heterogama]|uniref:7192_t:CDS:1 n=1 Tax=Dentiscutata heterogama TaxID=1316150 RepID=A0ACA9KK52_9GLOM|nr:7192_t:CDS:2 [Dentiscutata heterogama]
MDMLTNLASSAVANITISTIINAIKTSAEVTFQIYVNAECNKETTLIMTNRVKNAESIIEEFMRNDEEKFKRREFVIVLKRLESVLIKIKEFSEKVSKLKGYKQFTDAKEVKSKYEQLTEEYDTCIRDLLLHSAYYIANNDTKIEESQKVDKDLEETEKVPTLKDFDDKLDVLLAQKIAKQPSDINVKRIEPNELTDSLVPQKKNTLDNSIKKFYGTIEVACKNFQDSEDFRGHLAILEKLDHPYIRRFYGLSYVDIREVMVFEWAEYGSLKDLYNNYNIPWTRKLQIIRDICRGLVFLRNVNILHHDVRCENVLVPHNLDPKLGNFRYARTLEGTTTNLSDLVTMIIRWMAPELLMKYEKKNHAEKVYTFNCEMFSFGMLIWELCYEKLPYEDWGFIEISKHVLSDKREKLPYGKFDNQDDAKLQKELIEIIKNTWKQIPEDRITITKLYIKLEELAAEYPILPEEPKLLKNGTLDLEGDLMDLEKNETLDLERDLMDIEKNKNEDSESSNYGESNNNNKDIKGKKRASSPVKTLQPKRQK